jgi:hypothetical protein
MTLTDDYRVTWNVEPLGFDRHGRYHVRIDSRHGDYDVPLTLRCFVCLPILRKRVERWTKGDVRIFDLNLSALRQMAEDHANDPAWYARCRGSRQPKRRSSTH